MLPIQILNHQLHRACAHNLLLGNFNSDTGICDRFNSTTGQCCGKPGPELNWFWSTFASYTEIAQDDFTHRSNYEGSHQVCSRIDRIYSSLPPSHLADLHIVCCTSGRIAAPDFTASDHVPVSFRLSTKRSGPGFPTIPGWIPKHALWRTTLESLFVPLAPHERPLQCLGATKALLFKAAAQVIAQYNHHGAQSCDEKLWWAVNAARYIRAFDLDSFASQGWACFKPHQSRVENTVHF